MAGWFASYWFSLALKVLFTGFVFLVISGISGFVIVVLKRKAGTSLVREHTLKLQNLGNTPSVFRLSVASPHPGIKFQFNMNQVPMPEVPQPELTLPAATHTSDFSRSPGDALHKGTPASQTIKDAGKTSKAMIGKTGQAATFLGTLGSLIPGSMGKKLKEQGNAARNAQISTAEMIRKPEEALRKTESLNKGVSQAGARGKMPGEKSLMVHEAVIEQQAMVSPAGMGHQSIYQVQTPEIDPGEMLVLALRITGKDKRLTGNSSLYNIISHQIPLVKTEKEIPGVSKFGSVQFKRAKAWRYWVPNVIGGLVGAAALLSFIYISTLLWL
jgi:hypothetical protein